MILSTQNPVDLDYKAMSNAGTWMVGRLQTENDKKRILEGLASATGEVDVGVYDNLSPTLEKPVRAEHYKVLRANPVWDALGHVLPRRPADQGSGVGPDERSIGARHRGGTGDHRWRCSDRACRRRANDQEDVPVMPAVSEGVATVYLDPAATWAGEVGADLTAKRLTAAIAATVNLTYDDTKAGVNHQEAFEAVVFPVGPVLGPDTVREIDHDPRDFRSDPPEGAAYVLPEQKIDTKSFWTAVGTDLTNHLVGGAEDEGVQERLTEALLPPRRIAGGFRRGYGSGRGGGGRGHRQDAGDARGPFGAGAGGPGQGREPSGGPRGDRRIETDRGVVVRGRGHHRGPVWGPEEIEPARSGGSTPLCRESGSGSPKMRRPP